MANLQQEKIFKNISEVKENPEGKGKPKLKPKKRPCRSGKRNKRHL